MPRLVRRRHCLYWRVALAALAIPAVVLGESSGQIDLSLQGYFLAHSGQRVIDISGSSARFDLLLPRLGMLRGNLEGYRSQSRLRLGDNFIELPALGWQGFRWGLTGGDFRITSSLTSFRFSNIIYPDLSLRGGRVTATRGGHQFSVFHGIQTLQSGPRIPYRLSTGQRVSGADARFRLGEQLEFGLRLLNIQAGSGRETYNPWFTWGQQFDRSRSLNAQLLYSPAKHLRLYSEAGVGQASEPATAPPNGPSVSAIAGASWESERVTVRANYARQTALYLPVAGFFLGDRQGPYAEVRLRPFRRLEVFSSASQARNNLAADPTQPSFFSRSQSAGASLQLPGKFMVTGQASRLLFDSHQPEALQQHHSDNRIWSGTIARPLGRHNFRYSLRDLRLAQPSRLDRQRSQELEDTFQWKALIVSGAVRLDRSLTDQSRSTLYARGNIQVRARRVSAYAYVEAGRDLVNESLLTTNAIATSILGMNLRLGGGWDLQAEAFRYSLRSALNPGNLFVLQSQGIGVPSSFAGLNQWSFYTRLNKQLAFGPPMPSASGRSGRASDVRAPGSVEGFVFETRDGNRAPVPAVAVGLDGSESVLTDQDGRYRFPRVAEGPHKVALVLDQLPAEFDPGPPPPEYIVIQPGLTARLDFTLFRLASFCGSVQAPSDSDVDKILIRLESTSSYTTPESDGRFCFHNLHAGQYVVLLSKDTIREGFKLASPDRIPIKLTYGSSLTTRVKFSIERIQIKLSTRRVLDNKPVQVAIPAATPPAPATPQPVPAKLCGSVRAPAGVPLDRILIHLIGTPYVISPDSSGDFCFADIPDSKFTVAILSETIPPGTLLAGPARLSVSPIEFVLRLAPRKPAPKPAPKPVARPQTRKLPPPPPPAPKEEPLIYIVTPVDPGPSGWRR
ncbi:MAG: carboxypeptidase regulatory-like domain-containing protein [Bryobacterales bacterium]|nr:carboxypeptidase regulatory-like domain-containing protein [Bryobacterales bacterium]